MKNKNLWHEHSLSIVVFSFLAFFIVQYMMSDEQKHVGAFFGNAIADWTGTLVIVLATKVFYEKGSPESRRPQHRPKDPVLCFLNDHSLSIFLIITGIGWVTLYAFMDPQAKWGQVVGNIVSEWTQIFCLVIFTKRLVERHSKESKR